MKILPKLGDCILGDPMSTSKMSKSTSVAVGASAVLLCFSFTGSFPFLFLLATNI